VSRTVSVVCRDHVTAEAVRNTLISSGLHDVDVVPVRRPRAMSVRAGRASVPRLIASIVVGSALAIATLAMLVLAPGWLVGAVLGGALGVMGARVWSAVTAELSLPRVDVVDAAIVDEPETQILDFTEEDTILDLARWRSPQDAIPMLPDPDAEAGVELSTRARSIVVGRTMTTTAA